MKGLEMFFLLRCAFFLGLVFLNLDWKTQDPVLPSVETVAQAATSQCMANPKLCMDVVSEAQKIAAAVPLPPQRGKP